MIGLNMTKLVPCPYCTRNWTDNDELVCFDCKGIYNIDMALVEAASALAALEESDTSLLTTRSEVIEELARGYTGLLHLIKDQT
jgi:hypothetical protein